MRNAVADLPVVEIDERFHNLIPSRFPTVRLYERIAGGRDDLFAAIEGLTNPRVREKERLTYGLARVDQDQHRFKNWNHAPFVYPNPEGSRFFAGDRNVIELASDLQTALVVSVSRRELFLARTAEPSTFLEMRQIVRPVRGRFLDVRDRLDIIERADRLSLGKKVLAEGLDGLLFSPSERPSGTGAIVLRPECLGKPDQAEHFKYIWNGNQITVLYAFGSGKEIDPTQLSQENSVLAA
jgi:hypothetical protein